MTDPPGCGFPGPSARITTSLETPQHGMLRQWYWLSRGMNTSHSATCCFSPLESSVQSFRQMRGWSQSVVVFSATSNGSSKVKPSNCSFSGSSNYDWPERSPETSVQPSASVIVYDTFNSFCLKFSARLMLPKT